MSIEKLEEVRGKIRATNTQIINTKEQIEDFKSMLNSIKYQMTETLSSLKNSKIKNLEAPLLRKKEELNKKLEKSKAENFSVTNEEIKKNSVKEFLKLEKLDKLIQDIKKEMKVEYDLDITPYDKEYVLNNLSDLLKEYKKIEKEIKNIQFIDISDAKKLMDLLVKPPKECMMPLLAVLLLIIFAFIIDNMILMFTGVIGVAIVVGGYALYKNSKIPNYYEALCKLEATLPLLYTLLNEKVLDIRNEKERDFNLFKLDKVNEIQSEIDIVQRDLNSAYSSDISKEERDGIVNSSNREIDNYKSKIKTFTNRLEELKKLLADLLKEEELLKKSLTDSVMSYGINKSNYLLPKKLMIDTETFIDLKRGLNTFYYDDSKDKFLKLIISQLMMSINPFSISFTVFDTITIGRDLIDLMVNRNIIDVIYEESKITEVINEEIQIYHKNIKEMRNMGTVDDYNEYMISIDSLTKEYKIFVFIDPSDSVLKSQDFRRLYEISSKCGVIPILLLKNGRNVVVDDAKLISKGNIFNKTFPAIDPKDESKYIIIK